MYAILSETNETIALKKKQIKENQISVNMMAIEMSEKVQKILNLEAQVIQLENELYKLEKQVRNESNISIGKSLANFDCCSAKAPTESEIMGRK